MRRKKESGARRPALSLSPPLSPLSSPLAHHHFFISATGPLAPPPTRRWRPARPPHTHTRSSLARPPRSRAAHACNSPPRAHPSPRSFFSLSPPRISPCGRPPHLCVPSPRHEAHLRHPQGGRAGAHPGGGQHPADEPGGHVRVEGWAGCAGQGREGKKRHHAPPAAARAPTFPSPSPFSPPPHAPRPRPHAPLSFILHPPAISLDDKIKKLDAQLLVHRDAIRKARPGPAADAAKRRALAILKQKKLLEGQREQLYAQQFNMEQTAFALDSVKDTVQVRRRRWKREWRSGVARGWQRAAHAWGKEKGDKPRTRC